MSASAPSTRDDDRVPSPFEGAAEKLERGLTTAVNRITGTALAPYQSAVVRIGFSLTFTLFLLREWPHRLELYGNTSPWSFGMAERLIAGNQAFSVLMWSGGRWWFELVYHGAILAGVLLLLGWRTRTASVLFMVGVLAVQNRSVFVGDGGDNVIHLMSIYLVLTRCGQVWSLDARRRVRQEQEQEQEQERWAGEAPGARPRRDGRPDPAGGRRGTTDRTGVVLWAAIGLTLLVTQAIGFAELRWFDAIGPVPVPSWALGLWGVWLVHGLWWLTARLRSPEPRALLDVLANLLHNGAMLVIALEVCFVYATAGWYKIQGSRWQDGTALYYPLNLDYFDPWPGLSDLFGSSGLMVMVITYGTVIVQVAFPFTLFNRRVKNVLLAMMMAEHMGIAVLLGLPFFSLAMIAADAVFLPTGFLRWLGSRLAAARRSLTGRVTGGRTPGEGDRPAPVLPAPRDGDASRDGVVI